MPPHFAYVFSLESLRLCSLCGIAQQPLSVTHRCALHKAARPVGFGCTTKTKQRLIIIVWENNT